MPIAAVREKILVSDSASQVFAGTLQEAIDPHGTLTLEQAEAALYTAAAEDVFLAMDGGWQGRLDEKGRGLSGGQRQRVVLARALARDADILIMVEPTSAVDAHTEAMIAERLAAYREGTDDHRHHRLAAAAALRRPGGVPVRRAGGGVRHARGAAAHLPRLPRRGGAGAGRATGDDDEDAFDGSRGGRPPSQMNGEEG